MQNKKILIGIIAIILLIGSSLVTAAITVVSPTNNSYKNDTSDTWLNVSFDGPPNNGLITLNSRTQKLLDSNVIRYYNFNNISGIGDNTTRARDISINQQNMTLDATKTAYVTGKYGMGLNLSNSTSQVTMPAWTETENFTLMMWVNPNKNLTDQIAYSNIFHKVNNTCGWELERGSSNYILYVVNGSARALTTFTTNQYYSIPNVWRFITLTRQGNTFSIYDNGILRASATYPNYCVASAVTLNIGNGGWTGIYDDVRLYDVALSATEIKQEYQSSLNMYSATNYSFIANVSYSHYDLMPTNTWRINYTGNDSGNYNFYYCLTPVDDYYIYQPAKFCDGVYYGNDTAANGFIIIVNNDTSVSGGNTTIISTNFSDSNMVGIANPNRINKNISVNNITLKGFYIGLSISDINNTVVDGVIADDNRGWGMFIADFHNLLIKNSKGINTQVQHGLYLSVLDDLTTGNVTIDNSTFSNGRNMLSTGSAGIQVNGGNKTLIHNITIKNSILDNNSFYYSILLFDAIDVEIFNNNITNNAEGIRITWPTGNGNAFNYSSRNVRVHDNIFNGNGNDISAIDTTFNNNVYNNTYLHTLNTTNSFKLRSNASWPINTTLSIYETDPIALRYDVLSVNAPESYLMMNFTKQKNVSINNFNIIINDFYSAYPYNDLRNVTGGNILNIDVDDLVITMSSNIEREFGDYSCDKHYKDSGMSYSCNATACYFTSTNCTVKTSRTS